MLYYNILNIILFYIILFYIYFIDKQCNGIAIIKIYFYYYNEHLEFENRLFTFVYKT